MSTDNHTLLVRALNNTRHTYFPSYAALRMLGEQLSHEKGHFLEGLLLRRLKAGDKWRFKPFSMYKGTHGEGENATHEYRACIAGSPLTALAESYLLSKFANELPFTPPPHVYSYLWPRSVRGGSSYRFFAEGYAARNTEIALALAQPKTVAVVTDIRGFYPSLKKEFVTSRLKSAVASSSEQLRQVSDGILDFYAQLLESGTGGLPIGPASSHVIGNLALQDVDQILGNSFGDRYFRYVDDIVVVCDETEASKVELQIRSAARNQGLEINEEKTAKLNSEEWHRYVSRPDIETTDNFRDFCRDLTLYLAFHPKKSETLKRNFKDQGLSLPIDRLLSLSAYSRYRYYLSQKSSRISTWHKVSIYLASEKTFMERATRLKAVYEQKLTTHLEEKPEKIPNLRRWQVQRVRRIVNTLFYLRSFSEWSGSNETFRVIPELVEQAALGKALSTGYVDPILPFFGRGPAAFGELWAEHGQGYARTTARPNSSDAAILDSLTTLRLLGHLDESHVSSIEGQNRLLKAAATNPPLTRSSPDLSYEDEFESLRLGVDGTEISTLLKTRYSSRESSPLEALSLLSSEYRS
jgi:Reverse transcriptase (RNA-dependent DNA polymerase)